jgi:hypothetical protein
VDKARASTMVTRTTTSLIILLAAGLAFSIGAAASNIGMQSQATAQQQNEEFIGYKRPRCQAQLL